MTVNLLVCVVAGIIDSESGKILEKVNKELHIAPTKGDIQYAAKMVQTGQRLWFRSRVNVMLRSGFGFKTKVRITQPPESEYRFIVTGVQLADENGVVRAATEEDGYIQELITNMFGEDLIF